MVGVGGQEECQGELVGLCGLVCLLGVFLLVFVCFFKAKQYWGSILER